MALRASELKAYAFSKIQVVTLYIHNSSDVANISATTLSNSLSLIDTYAKFHEYWSNNNKVFMAALPLRLGQQKESPTEANEPLAKSKKVKKATDTKNPLNSKNNDVDGNEQSPENEDAGIIEEFDYHNSMNAENYEKYFEKICKLLKPNSLIIIDNASYHSRISDDYPKSKWKKAQFEQWLKENKVNFPSDAYDSSYGSYARHIGMKRMQK